MTALMINEYEVDRYNSRVLGFIVEDLEEAILKLEKLQQQINASKVICFTRLQYVHRLKKEGFIEEGKISAFFQGQDAMMIVKYFEAERAISKFQPVNEDVMSVVKMDEKECVSKAWIEDYTIHKANVDDAGAMSTLYRKVFQYYPANVHEPAYLRSEMGDDYVFVVIKNGEKIISAASAYIRPMYGCAEITDCVTDPDFQGKSLLSPIVVKLEAILREKGIQCAYSLTRSQSVGMNMTVKRLGYTYEGRLTNNCKIFSGFEDMNIWTKQL